MALKIKTSEFEGNVELMRPDMNNEGIFFLVVSVDKTSQFIDKGCPIIWLDLDTVVNCEMSIA